MDYNYYNYRNRKPISAKRKRPTKRLQYPNSHKIVKRKLNKKKVFVTALIFILIIYWIVKPKQEKTVETSEQSEITTNQIEAPDVIPVNNPGEEKPAPSKEITEWNLRLANYENLLPEDFEVELSEIADEKYFDARAVKYLKKMINDMGHDGIRNIWVQSAYRSVARQKELYENSVNKYLKQGKTQEEAKRLTDEYINKPGASDHNLGLAVDFNNVDNNFEDLDAFKWLQKNAENYGFILRYPKDKEDITKICYESWHWRYVGEEHAKKINELNMCLEEYIQYLENKEED